MPDRRLRTAKILTHYREAQEQITDGNPVRTAEQAERLDGLVQDAIRLLRENKTICVREEQAGRSPDASYTKAKAEIDQAVGLLLRDKAELREFMRHGSDTASGAEALSSSLPDQIGQLADLFRLGALTREEFAAAKAQLLS